MKTYLITQFDNEETIYLSLFWRVAVGAIIVQDASGFFWSMENLKLFLSLAKPQNEPDGSQAVLLYPVAVFNEDQSCTEYHCIAQLIEALAGNAGLDVAGMREGREIHFGLQLRDRVFDITLKNIPTSYGDIASFRFAPYTPFTCEEIMDLLRTDLLLPGLRYETAQEQRQRAWNAFLSFLSPKAILSSLSKRIFREDIPEK